MRATTAATAVNFAVASKFLHALPRIDLTGIDVAVRVDSQSMYPVELAHLTPGTANSIELLEVLPIDDIERAVGEVADIEAALRVVCRERG